MLKQFTPTKIVKQDVLGYVETGIFTWNGKSTPAIRRVYRTAKWWARPLAQLLAYNEKKTLQRLHSIARGPKASVPQLLHSETGAIVRAFIPATLLYKAPPRVSNYYQQAKALIRTMRKLGVCNNDLSKESNWLVTDDGRPVLVDFQLALRCKKNRKILRLFCREDLRHLLKHKRKYCPQALTAKEKQILAHKSLLNRIWSKTIRRIYRQYTRNILGWKSRGGPYDRGRTN